MYPRGPYHGTMSGRILVVDDDEVVRNVLRGKLESCGHEVVEASDGKQAMERLSEGVFDVVITDILMPERDGLETLLHVRKTHPGVKVIAITGAGTSLHLDNARNLGASRVFAKPFKLEEIAAAVRELVSA